MTVLEVIQRSSEFLMRKGVDSPRLQVELLLEKTLGMPRLKLYLNHELVLTEVQLAELRDLVKRRAAREPLQHLTGTTSFCGYPMAVGPDVLVPRPETELLAERAWVFLEQRALQDRSGSGLHALDLGCGSGCLAIALARRCPGATVDAVDCSEAALARAQTNVEANQVADRVALRQGDWLQAIPREARYDVIVSNPPYIPTAEIDRLQPEVRDFDPRLALDGGDDGLDFYRSLSREAGVFLKKGGCLLLECGDGQAEAVTGLFQGAGWQVKEVVNDYGGVPRIVIACVDE